MIDTDKLFEKHLSKWISDHRGEYTADELEDMIPTLYEEWVTSPNAETDGLTPEAYFDAVTDAEKLVAEFASGNACSLLCDRLLALPECAPHLVALIEKNPDPKTTVTAMNILSDMGQGSPLALYADWIISGKADESVAETAAEILTENPSPVAEKIFAAISNATPAQKQIFADILVSVHDEREYALIKEVFESGENIPLAASLAAKYGDERAAEFLYPALDTANYLEYIEIRNAIERLGGTVDEQYRDFSSDPYYRALKDIK